jgi:hypothetical protein
MYQIDPISKIHISYRNIMLHRLRQYVMVLRRGAHRLSFSSMQPRVLVVNVGPRKGFAAEYISSLQVLRV